jgi:anaerobic magnesium-protoporphyrin IX monomethyl ester cyclase
MKVALIGPELEENLSLRYLHASLTKDGHDARIMDFHSPDQIEAIAAEIIEWGTEIVGLSMVFTARAQEFIALAVLLRKQGFPGRIVAGGHFATFHASDLLIKFPAIDFIVHGEGELTLNDLLCNLVAPRLVAGISFRDEQGRVQTTEPRPNPADLDILPPPTRTPPFYTYMGIPIANILGSRGCFGHCTFCSISAWYRSNTGPRFRQRNVSSIVFEMARLYNEHGVRIFNFHDDTFFLPDEQANIERFAAMERALQSKGMTDIAVQVKARTDAVTPAVLEVLSRIGLFRVFLGVENHSPEGLKSLGKGTTVDQNRQAINLLCGNNIHVTFNLLMFGPDTTVRQIQENIGCIREFADVPINFGRAEVYSGTPLEHALRKTGRLAGDWFGYHYDIAEPRVQHIFDIFRSVFTERNFQTGGMNFLAMKLDYYYHILKHFNPSRVDLTLFKRKQGLLEELNYSNADILDIICRDVCLDKDENRRLADALLRKRRRTDADLRKAFSDCIRDIEQRPYCRKRSRATMPRRAAVVSAAAAALMLSVQQCAKNDHVTTGEPLSPEQHSDTLAQLNADEAAYVEQRLLSLYKPAIDSMGRAIGFVNRSVLCNLCLDSAGRVDSCCIITPPKDSAPAFHQAFDALTKSWIFPDIRRPGICGIAMIVAKPDSDWHYSEIISYPLDTVNRPLEFNEYDSADIRLINRKIDTEYSSSVILLFSQYSIQNFTVSITLRIDFDGGVAGCSIDSSTAASYPQFAAALRDSALTWKFPGVSRQGSCTIKEGFFMVEPTIFEIMAFPRDSVEGPGN